MLLRFLCTSLVLRAPPTGGGAITVSKSNLEALCRSKLTSFPVPSDSFCPYFTGNLSAFGLSPSLFVFFFF